MLRHPTSGNTGNTVTGGGCTQPPVEGVDAMQSLVNTATNTATVAMAAAAKAGANTPMPTMPTTAASMATATARLPTTFLPGRLLLRHAQTYQHHHHPHARHRSSSYTGTLAPTLPLASWTQRYKYFFDIASPMRLLTTRRQLDNAISFIHQCEEGMVANTAKNQRKLWRAVTTRDSMVHPDTGDIIPVPMRRAFFLPSNLPIFLGMLLAPQTTAWITAFQVLNNGYSTAMNYMNRNASSSQTPLQMAGSFSLAVGLSTGIAVQVRKLVDRLAMRPWAATVWGRAVTQSLVPFAAMATAGTINLVMARYGEALNGVVVRDESGNQLGRSVVAGRDAVQQTVLSRVLMPLLPASIPPLLMHGLQKYRPHVVAPFGRMVAIKTAIVTLILTIGLPFSLAPFPYTVSRSVTDLEPHFATMVNPTTGQPVQQVFYNRGL